MARLAYLWCGSTHNARMHLLGQSHCVQNICSHGHAAVLGQSVQERRVSLDDAGAAGQGSMQAWADFGWAHKETRSGSEEAGGGATRDAKTHPAMSQGSAPAGTSCHHPAVQGSRGVPCQPESARQCLKTQSMLQQRHEYLASSFIAHLQSCGKQQ